jgi:hypothetical protein
MHEMNIYDLTDKLKRVNDLIDEGAENLDDTLESLELTFDEKVKGYAAIIRNTEAEEKALKDEIDRLNAKRKVKQNKINYLKDNLFNALQATDKRKVEAGTFTLSIRKNPHSVSVLDEKALPKQYYVEQPMKLDKTKLKDDLKSGLKIAGAELVQNESLSIK